MGILIFFFPEAFHFWNENKEGEADEFPASLSGEKILDQAESET